MTTPTNPPSQPQQPEPVKKAWSKCPFCGGSLHVLEKADSIWPDFVVNCSKCDFRFKTFSVKEKAIEFANRRTPPVQDEQTKKAFSEFSATLPDQLIQAQREEIAELKERVRKLVEALERIHRACVESRTLYKDSTSPMSMAGFSAMEHISHNALNLDGEKGGEG